MAARWRKADRRCDLLIGEPCVLHQKAQYGEIYSVELDTGGHNVENHSFDDLMILISFYLHDK